MKYSNEISKAYNAPFPDSKFKSGVAQWPLLVPLMADDPVAYHMFEVEKFLITWKKPTLGTIHKLRKQTRGEGGGQMPMLLHKLM